MSLKSAFVKGVNTIFTVFKDAVKDGEYVYTTNNGFDGDETESCSVRVILDNFKQDDIGSYSFAAKIQPTDTMGLVPGQDVTVSVVRTGAKITVIDRVFEVVAFDTDPLQALYTFLLRDSA